MRLLLLFAASASLFAQPALRTEWRNGIQRAVAMHADAGTPVTDDNPAASGETLLLAADSMPDGATLWVNGSQTGVSVLDDGSLQFVLADDAKGGFVSVALVGADGTRSVASIPGPVDPDQLSPLEVLSLIQSAANTVDDPHITVAVVDRAGRPLGLFGRESSSPLDVERALSLARTGAFFSHNQAPLSSITVFDLSTEHFPEIAGINNQAAALFGIELTNRGCRLSDSYIPGQEVPRSQNRFGKDTGLGISTIPGGVPLYRRSAAVGNQIGKLIGGIGVAGVSQQAGEFAVLVASGFGSGAGFSFKLPLPEPQAVFVDGIRLEEARQTTRPAGTHPGSLSLSDIAAGMITDDQGNVMTARAGSPAPEGYLIAPVDGNGLSKDEVTTIIQNTLERASRTRALIRLPLGARAKFVIAVSDLDGNLLGMFRMPDSTIFSIDVAATKSRNVVYFSSTGIDPQDLPSPLPKGTAITNRTLDFGAQHFFPSGILNSSPGPFRPLFDFDQAHPCTQGHQPVNANQSGIVFFPGAAPLYKNGKLVGGLGVSGDGVDQDDYATSGGIRGFEPPPNIRADQFFIRGVRLPYLKFPRNPEQ